MGVDLDLIPYERSKWPRKGMVPHFEDNKIDFPRWYAIYDYINAAKPKPIPDRVFVVTREQYASDQDSPICSRQSPIGGRLTYLPAGKLKRAILSATPIAKEFPGDWKEYVVQALKQLSKLKPSTPVILAWG